MSWLEGLAPCRSCVDKPEDYLKSLSAEKLLKDIELYEESGKTDNNTCQCTPSVNCNGTTSAPPLPLAECYLHEGNWPHDVRCDSVKALQWIKNRLEEVVMEEKMQASWAKYLSRKGLFGTKFCTRFISWALFPTCSTFLWYSKRVFGPGPEKSGIPGTVLELKNHRGSTGPAGIVSEWLSYLVRPTGCSDSGRGPPLTHTVGVMVSEPGFLDCQALDIYAPYKKCDIEVFPAHNWGNAGFASPAGYEDDRAFCLKKIQGPTMLYLSCCVLRDHRSCEKLLQLESTGRAIVNDLIASKFVGPLEGRIEGCLKTLMKDARQMDTEWNFDRLCGRLVLWFRVWICRPKQEGSGNKPARLFLKELLNLWKPLGRARRYAPDTAEGWEDTVEITALGAHFGSAVATVVKLSLGRVEARLHKLEEDALNIGVAEDCTHNALALLALILKSNISIKTEAIKQKILHHFKNKAEAINEDELSKLLGFLGDVRASLSSITTYYAKQLDGARLHKAFQQAFHGAVGHGRITSEDVRSFFTDGAATKDLTSLRDGAVTHYMHGFGKVIFEDLESLRAVSYTEEELKNHARFRHCWKVTLPYQNPNSTPQLAQQFAQMSAHVQPAPQGTPATPTTPTTPVISAVPAAPPTSLVPAAPAVPAAPPAAPAAPVVIRRGSALASQVPVIIHPQPRHVNHEAAAPNARAAWHFDLGNVYGLLAAAVLMTALLLPLLARSGGRGSLSPRSWFTPPKFAQTSCTVHSKECFVTHCHEISGYLYVSKGDIVEILGSGPRGWLKVKIKDLAHKGVSHIDTSCS